MSSDEKFPVNIDLGASAKLSVDIKGTIPEKSLGGLLDCIVDIIRPFSEARALRADHLRLQREDVFYEITQRAKNRLQLENKPIRPIPIKTIVPLLEKASLEDPNSELIDWWAHLLASSSQDQGLQHPVYSDALSKITSAEAAYLERMAQSSNAAVVSFQEADIERLFYNHVVAKFSESEPNIPEDGYRDIAINLFEEFRKDAESNACVIFSLLFPAGGVKFSRDLYEEFRPYGRSYQDITDVLRAVSLAKVNFLNIPVPSPYVGEFSCSIEVFTLTSLGRNMLRACKKGSF